MAGLRERQKEVRRKAITDAALELFSRQGFHGTTIEQIAGLAGVSVPTVFNYFGSKQQILLDILRGSDELMVLDSRTVLEGFESAVEALCYMESHGTLHTLQILPASVWREILPLMLTPGSAFFDSYQASLKSHQQQMSSLVERLMDKGMLDPRLDVALCIQSLMDISFMQLIRLVAEDPPDLEAHQQYIQGVIQMLVRGIQAG